MSTTRPPERQSGTRCPVCLSNATRYPTEGILGFDCPQCGPIQFSPGGLKKLKEENLTKSRRYEISAKLRDLQLDHGNEPLDEDLVSRILRSKFYAYNRSEALYYVLAFLSGGHDGRYTATRKGWSAILQVPSWRRLEGYLSHWTSSGFIEQRFDEEQIVIALTARGREEAKRRQARKEIERSAPPWMSGETPSTLVKLSLVDFRCFTGSQEVRFCLEDGSFAQWTVIVGENGAGKSTILQLIAGLYPVASIDGSDYQPAFNMIGQNQYINSGLRSKVSSVELQCAVKGSKSEDYIISGFSETNLLSDLISNLRAEFNSCAIRGGRGLRPLTYGGGWGALRRITPLFCYSATRTPGGDHASTDDEQPTIQSLFSATTVLRDPQRWILKADHAARIRGQGSAGATQRLKRIKEVMVSVLPDVKDVRIAPPEDDSLGPRVLFETPYGRVKYSDLSVGYQTAVSLAADLGTRLFDHYSDSESPLEEPALVIIDELDLHIHPSWQRKIMGWMGGLFPKTQFIVTTHSPFIVQGIEGANIVLLSKEQSGVRIINDYDEIVNWRIDQIITSELFGIDSLGPLWLKTFLNERRDLLSKSALSSKERARLQVLNAMAHNLPSAPNLTDQRAMELIRRSAERLAKF